jgi:predicted DNA-binding transcriptional regulator AlpA
MKENTMTIQKSDSAVRAPLEPLLTIEDLERLLRVNRRTVARLCQRGQLPKPMKLGGSNRWRMRDIKPLL